MLTPHLIAAARLLREEGYAVVKLEWTLDMAAAGEEALEASEHLRPADAAAHIYGAVLATASTATVRGMGELETDEQAAAEAVWASVPDAAKVDY